MIPRMFAVAALSICSAAYVARSLPSNSFPAMYISQPAGIPWNDEGQSVFQ